MEYFVTSIKEITSKRRAVYVDYEHVFALYAGELRKFGIKEQSYISEDVYDEIMTVLSKRAVIRGMNLLKNKDYTRAEFIKKLKDGYYPDKAVDAALEYIDRYGYIDDDRYARNYVAFKAPIKSRRIIEQKLKEKGVSADIIACVCDEYYSDNGECELNQVVSLIEKRTSKTDISRMDYNERQKLMAYLYRRGFNFDIINKAIDKVCDNCM